LPLLMRETTTSRRFAKFIAVGGVGFIVDAAVLTLAVGNFGASIYPARALSFSVAVFVTWLLNRTFVFDSVGRRVPIVAEYSRYLVTQIAGAFCNLAVFAALIEALPRLAATPVVPLAAGAVLGALVNYGGSAWWVFQRKRRTN
jgi:putative flippase GtrA